MTKLIFHTFLKTLENVSNLDILQVFEQGYINLKKSMQNHPIFKIFKSRLILLSQTAFFLDYFATRNEVKKNCNQTTTDTTLHITNTTFFF